MGGGLASLAGGSGSWGLGGRVFCSRSPSACGQGHGQGHGLLGRVFLLSLPFGLRAGARAGARARVFSGARHRARSPSACGQGHGHGVSSGALGSEATGLGDPAEVGPYLGTHGGVDETCMNYQAKNLYEDFKCDAIGVCRNCEPKRGCYAMGSPVGKNNFTRYYAAEWGRINSTDVGANAKQMVAEIGVRGPISGSICVTPEFEAYTGGVFEDTTGCTSLDHSISIAGYGHDATSGKDYWIIRNSWGTYWGEQGWARNVRGTNNLGIETTAEWITPLVQ